MSQVRIAQQMHALLTFLLRGWSWLIQALGRRVPKPIHPEIPTAEMTDQQSPLLQSNHKLPVVLNWLARSEGAERIATFEFPLFSDAGFTGQVRAKNWPYEFLNTVPTDIEAGEVKAPLILRCHIHAPQSVVPDFSKTDSSAYHGGVMTDEVAALASLCTGTRLRAGGMSRAFDPSTQDPLGRPVSWDRRAVPAMRLNPKRLVLPDVVGLHNLDSLHRFESLPSLSGRQAVALVRAARLYQDALWIAESEPALAWLMLVSAIETAADDWSATTGTPIDRLEQSKPELVQMITEASSRELAEKIANAIEPSLGATKKFVEFSLAFLPQPPQKRPLAAFQIEWEPAALKKTFGIIYGYRSKALHGGTPFPAPMCEPAETHQVMEGVSERGTTGLAASTMGGFWRAKDLPVNLHMYHYLVRETLLKWWASLES